MFDSKTTFTSQYDVKTGDLNGSGLTVAVVLATYNGEIATGLLDGCMQGLFSCQLTQADISIYSVDGCVEIPVVAQGLIKKNVFDVVICLGAVIKGESAHFEYVCDMVSQGISSLSLTYNIPVIFGVLTVLTYDQAIQRIQKNESNKGFEAALTAVKTVRLMQQIS